MMSVSLEHLPGASARMAVSHHGYLPVDADSVDPNVARGLHPFGVGGSVLRKEMVP